jgi:hypothetical protein
MMKKSLSVVLAVLLAGSTSLAVAQTSAEVANASSSKDLSAVKKRFADQFASFQDISDGKAPAWSLRKPTFSNAPANPTAGLDERQMQALSSESPGWQLDHGKVEADRGPTFAQTHPQGLSFSQYQANSSNSGEFALPANADTSSFAATGTVNVAGDTAKPTIRERIANFLHRGGAAKTTDAQ